MEALKPEIPLSWAAESGTVDARKLEHHDPPALKAIDKKGSRQQFI